jgi:hypothetical protein
MLLSPTVLAILAVAYLSLFATLQTFLTYDHSNSFLPYSARFAPNVVLVYLKGDSLAQSVENLVWNSSIYANVTSLSA